MSDHNREHFSSINRRENTPFYENPSSEHAPYGEHCLQMCLKMILKTLEPEHDYSLKELETITNKGKGPTFASHHLLWMHRRGLEVVHITNFDWEALRDDGLNYYKKLGTGQLEYNKRSDLDKEREVITDFLTEVPVIHRPPLIKDIATALTEGWRVRVSVNATTLDPEKGGYFGHSVVALDIEDSDIIFHDPGLPAQAYRREPQVLFQAAMDSFGGMMDLIRKRT